MAKVRNWKEIPRDFVTPVGNVLELLSVMTSYGDKTLYRYRSHGEDAEISYIDFVESVKIQAAGFESIGLAGKTIAMIGATSPEWLRTYLSVLACGGIIVPMDKELAEPEIRGFLAQVDASAIVYTSGLNKSFEDLLTLDCLQCLIPVDAEGCSYSHHEKVVSYDDLMARGKANVSYHYPPVLDREALAEFLFTSGTTGTSKCVMLSQKNIFMTATAAALTVPFYKDDLLLSVLPPHHTYELACLLAEMILGITTCINDSLRNVMRNIQKYQPTALVLVPLFVQTMYKKIQSEAEKSGKAGMLKIGSRISRAAMAVGIDVRDKVFKSVNAAFGGRLKKIICGGAALDPEIIQAFDDFGIAIFEGFGITECSPLTNVTPYYARKPGSVGPAVPCCTVRIVGDVLNDKGFMEGELQVKGDNVMIGYYRNDEANEAAFTDDGWFRTGDIAYMDEDGYVFITGRLKSVIVLDNGKNVFPEEIEEYLEKIDAIAESVVVGRESQESGNVELVAIVFPNSEHFAEGTSEEEIKQSIKAEIFAMNKKLPSFKQVRKIEYRSEPFEKTTSHKIKRHLVK